MARRQGARVSEPKRIFTDSLLGPCAVRSPAPPYLRSRGQIPLVRRVRRRAPGDHRGGASASEVCGGFVARRREPLGARWWAHRTGGDSPSRYGQRRRRVGRACGGDCATRTRPGSDASVGLATAARASRERADPPAARAVGALGSGAAPRVSDVGVSVP